MVASMIIAERTYDDGLIREIMTLEAIWATVAEDGQVKSDYQPDSYGDCWLTLKEEDEVLGLYQFKVKNRVLLQCHPAILPEHRNRALEASKAAFLWILEYAPGYKKMSAEIPRIYRNVKLFAMQCGFKVEGLSRSSYLKSGKLVDVWQLGATKQELEYFCYG